MALRIYDASNWVTVDEGFKVGDAIFSEAILTYSMYIELGNSTPLYFPRNLPRSRTLWCSLSLNEWCNTPLIRFRILAENCSDITRLLVISLQLETIYSSTTTNDYDACRYCSYIHI